MKIAEPFIVITSRCGDILAQGEMDSTHASEAAAEKEAASMSAGEDEDYTSFVCQIVGAVKGRHVEHIYEKVEMPTPRLPRAARKKAPVRRGARKKVGR